MEQVCLIDDYMDKTVKCIDGNTRQQLIETAELKWVNFFIIKFINICCDF